MTGRFSLAGEVAVVTGALGRLGPVWVDALIEAGATVAALDRAGTRPSPAFTELSDRVGEARVRRFDADITDRASIDAARGAIVEQFGVPSILVNNAGHRSAAGLGDGSLSHRGHAGRAVSPHGRREPRSAHFR